MRQIFLSAALCLSLALSQSMSDPSELVTVTMPAEAPETPAAPEQEFYDCNRPPKFKSGFSQTLRDLLPKM